MLMLLPVVLALFQPGAPAPEAGQDSLHARPTLVAETLSAAPGRTLWLALDFEIDPGWHTYWPGQNDSGFALEAEFEAPSNAEVGKPLWPAPRRYFPTDGILDHVFEERMTVLVPVMVSEEARPGDRLAFRADLTWLACADICLAETAEVALAVPVELVVGSGEPRANPDAAEAFRHARARLPEPLKADDGVEIEVDGSFLRIRAPGASRLAFYPLEGSRRARNLIRDGDGEGDHLGIELREGEGEGEGEEPIAGVLEVWTEDDAPSRLFDISFPRPAEGLPQPTGT